MRVCLWHIRMLNVNLKSLKEYLKLYYIILKAIQQKVVVDNDRNHNLKFQNFYWWCEMWTIFHNWKLRYLIDIKNECFKIKTNKC